MAITADDIKLMQPERLTENEDGGGQMTGQEIIDGDINNLFEDISRVNRTYGNVSLRKAFLKVDTTTDDLYLDAHSILSAQPEDPNVSGLMFHTNDFYDERTHARNRVESFAIPGPVTGLVPRGDQLEGQSTIIVYANRIIRHPRPEVGETFMLQEGENENTRQYIKVLDIEESRERFSYMDGEGNVRAFDADQYVLRLSTPLGRRYTGSDPNPMMNSTTRLYTTQPANFSRYYGTTRLAAGAVAGDRQIQVADTFAPIIPTASTETPIIDQVPAGLAGLVVPTTEGTQTITAEVADGATTELPTAAVPGSIEFTYRGTDYKESGEQARTSTGDQGALEGTVIDYRSGRIQWRSSQSSQTVEITWRPGVSQQRLPHTGTIEIGEANRNFNYVLQLNPRPAPGTFVASYRYLDKWYEVTDPGNGQLVGDGSGQIAYDTGSVVVTLQAQPDANSVIFFRWTDGDIFRQAAEDEDRTGEVLIEAQHNRIVPGSLTLTWTSGGEEKTATDSVTSGQLEGDATGRIRYVDGRIYLDNPPMPDSGTDWELSYDHTPAGQQTETFNVAENTEQLGVTMNLPGNVKPGTVRFSLQLAEQYEYSPGVSGGMFGGGRDPSAKFRFRTRGYDDDGNGNIKTRLGNRTVGTIDYETGEVSLNGGSVTPARPVVNKALALDESDNPANTNISAVLYQEEIDHEVLPAQTVEVRYVADGEGIQPFSGGPNGADRPWEIELHPHGPILPGSVIIEAGSDVLYDDGDGVLRRNWDTTTGAGQAVGTVDYESAAATVIDYDGRSSQYRVVGLIQGEDWALSQGAMFRAPSPLRPNGFTIRAETFEDGTVITAQADAEGNLTGDITGSVDLQNGIATVRFEELVTAATIFYNAVSFRQIPLDPAILGLDPVQLPADGRVPIIRDADILVLTHTDQEQIATPDAGDTVAAPRDRLHDIWIEDGEGNRLDPEQYTKDKEAGIVTMADPLTLQQADGSGLVGNLYLMHRVDEMALCTEARIDGTLQIAQPLYHDLPAEDTWVASAVYLGNLRARIRDWFSYNSDPGDFSNPKTNPSSAQYNQLAYPLAIDNRGSVPDRWKIRFTGAQSFDLLSEQRGQVASGNTEADFSPINPQTGTPYFTIKADGWGSGWSVNNTIRFDTDAAAAPLWVIRTVLPGLAEVDDDQMSIELRGDHN